MKAIIIGGGIGGPAAALALRRVGIEADVYERAAEIREVGAGLSLWSNAMSALSRLGVADTVAAGGEAFRVARTLNPAGATISETDLGPLAAAAGFPSVGAHRADLQRALTDALPRESLHTAAECVAVRESAGTVTATFADGRTATGDVLVGCDGIRSAVRRALFSPPPERYAGYTAWRGVCRHAPPRLKPGETVFVLGRGAQMGVLPIGGGRVYWFLTRNALRDGRDEPGKTRAALLALTAGWSADLRDVIGATEESAIFRNDIIDRPPAKEWGRGRVTLLGDAVHATTPNLGQGACMALEDAVVLARSLADAADPASGLRRYEDARRERTAYVVRQSFSLGRVFQLENAVLCRLRDWFVSTRLGQRQGMEVFRRLLPYPLPELSPAR